MPILWDRTENEWICSDSKCNTVFKLNDSMVFQNSYGGHIEYRCHQQVTVMVVTLAMN